MTPLVLPWPTGVTVNHLYENNKGGGKRLSMAAFVWRDEAIVMTKLARIHLTPGDLALHVRVIPPDDRRRDLDNLLKLTQDSIAAALDFDDRRISYVGIERCAPDKSRARLEIILQPFESWRQLHHRPEWTT